MLESHHGRFSNLEVKIIRVVLLIMLIITSTKLIMMELSTFYH